MNEPMGARAGRFLLQNNLGMKERCVLFLGCCKMVSRRGGVGDGDDDDGGESRAAGRQGTAQLGAQL